MSSAPEHSRRRLPAAVLLAIAWSVAPLAGAPFANGPAARADSQPDQSGALRVALYQGPGAGGKGPSSLIREFSRDPGFAARRISPEEIRAGALTNFDVVIFPGGSGSGQAAAIGAGGREAVRRFIARGGGYIGICAGAYLATSGFAWSLGLIDAKTVSPRWRRGRGQVAIELAGSGRRILGEARNDLQVLYANGPVVGPAQTATLPPYEVWAWFRTELAKHDSPAGVMSNTPAIFSAAYEQGRVVCVSPHPEQTPGLEAFVPAAARWAARRETHRLRTSE